MTIEQLLNCDAAKLESFTDEQLLEWFKPYLTVTRPELAEKPEQKQKRKAGESVAEKVSRQAKFDLAERMARNLGIDLDLDDL